MASKCCVIAQIPWVPHMHKLGSHTALSLEAIQGLQSQGSTAYAKVVKLAMATGRNLLVSKKFVLEHAAYVIAC